MRQLRRSSRSAYAVLAAGFLGLTVVAWFAVCGWWSLRPVTGEPQRAGATTMTMAAAPVPVVQPLLDHDDSQAYRQMIRTVGPRLLTTDHDPLPPWDLVPAGPGRDGLLTGSPRGPPCAVRCCTVRRQAGAYRLRAPPARV